MIKSFNGKTPKIAASAFVSEAAYIVGDVEIGENSSVWPGAVIRGDTGRVVIGKYTAIEDNCVVHSGKPSEGDIFIGDMVNIGHGAVIHGRKSAITCWWASMPSSCTMPKSATSVSSAPAAL